MSKHACTALLFALALTLTACGTSTPAPASSTAAPSPAPESQADDDGFISIFNGKDLTGWTPKIRKEELGQDKRNTFRVKDGVLQVRYDNYDQFDRAFGHLFYDTPHSHYILRLEYRFIGDEQQPGHPGGWAYMNSGVMIHGQSAESMGKDQDFPASIEVQLLGQKEGGPDRTTANICTPGTYYHQDGKAIKRHCNTSTSKTFYGEQWVQLEIEVHGHDKIIHRVNSEVVFEYEKPMLDKGNKRLDSGTISLQSESHQLDFRNIAIKVLDK